MIEVIVDSPSVKYPNKDGGGRLTLEFSENQRSKIFQIAELQNCQIKLIVEQQDGST